MSHLSTPPLPPTQNIMPPTHQDFKYVLHNNCQHFSTLISRIVFNFSEHLITSKFLIALVDLRLKSTI